MGAKVDTEDSTCSCECAGLVTGVGANVTDLKPGDRILAMAPGHFATYEQFPEWAVCKLRDDEDYTVNQTSNHDQCRHMLMYHTDCVDDTYCLLDSDICPEVQG